MTRFSFRLESLLTLRQSERDARRNELAALYAKQAEIAARRQALFAEQERQHEAMRTAGAAGPIDVRRLRDWQAYEATLRNDLLVLGRFEQHAASLVEQSQAALTAAQLEVEVLEKLRQRQQEQHRGRQERTEQRQLDEIAARRHARPFAH